MRDILISTLLIVSFGAVGYWFYNLDKGENRLAQAVEVPEHFTFEFWDSVTLEQLKTKLAEIADINQAHPIKRTNMLHHAVINKWQALEFTTEILKYDIDVDMRDNKWGATPLMWAVYESSPISVIQLLLEKGADPFIKSNTNSNLLISAVVSNERTGNSFIDPQVVQLFLDRGVSLTEKNNKGKSACDFIKQNPEFMKTALYTQKIAPLCE